MKVCLAGHKVQGPGHVLSRRQFIKGSAAVCGAVAAPVIIPASALGRGGAVAPSERIVMAGIGLGGRGTADLSSWVLPDPQAQFVAICDVRRERREAIKAMTDRKYGNTDCKTYVDMMEVLARPDIDAILTATGDRLHATVSILSMRAGKDVYTEKPASMTVAEGQAVVCAAKQYGRVYQAGMQRLSEANFIVCNELLRLGRLGEVKTVYAHLAPWGNVNMERKWLPEEPLPGADEVDWDRWLGPCPWRPYNKSYVQGGWRHHHDFYTSVIGEWGSHTFGQCQAALGLSDTSPVRYPYVPTPTADGMEMPFANGVTMIQKQEGWRGTCGVRYVGSEGWAACADGYARPEVSNPALLADYNKILQDYITRTGHVVGHMQDFFKCVKNRALAVANPVTMHRSMTTVHCANIAQWLKRDMTWDPVKEEFVNDEQANRLLSRAAREGWQIV
ncbi:MAG: Gfo/Idh/MocA family oxidoreductase [Kiritimatiellae bacterium]|nr:Gfo/Idh/MocA family oxidoreductase [Kiritimatiellia bacterium]